VEIETFSATLFVELVDQDQIVEDWNTYKLGAGSRPREPGPDLTQTPEPPEVGVVISAIDYVLSVGEKEFVTTNFLPQARGSTLGLAMTWCPLVMVRAGARFLQHFACAGPPSPRCQ